MTDHAADRRNPWRDSAWLMLLCAAAYMFGLTSHGLTNWQEARRAVVAREMHERGGWLVPTYFGEPYLAKPPMFYWVQLVIGRARGWLGAAPFSDETEVRLAVALGGLLGVLATYFASRSMLRTRFEPRVGDEAAWLSALGLASGVLYFRSSRIGELDVLLVPFVVIAVAMIVRSWRKWEERGVACGWSILAAALAATGAALTKGPPPVLLIGLAGFGTMMWVSSSRGVQARSGADRRTIVLGVIGAIVAPLLAIIMNGAVPFGLGWLGLVFFAGVGATSAVIAARLLHPSRRRIWIDGIKRTHPWVVLGLPAVVVWAWGRMVASEIGAETVRSLANTEIEDNLRVLAADSPGRNLGFFIYGLAPASLAMIAAVWWLLKEKPRLNPGERVPFAWCGIGLAVFSTIGKGVARYLTPVWPGVAMVSGVWLARTLREHERSGHDARARRVVVAVFIAAMAVQAWWYAVGRETHYSHRSPRAFVAALSEKAPGLPVVSWRLREPAFEFYHPARLDRMTTSGDVVGMVNRSGEVVLIGVTMEAPRWESEVRDAGLRVVSIGLPRQSAWRLDGKAVGAWRISPP